MRTYIIMTVKPEYGNYEPCEADDPNAVWSIYSCDEKGRTAWEADAHSRESAQTITESLEAALLARK